MNFSRRRFGGHVTGAAVGAALAACGAEGSDGSTSKRAVVLVHGSWFGGWSYAQLIPLLAAKGITAVAPDLPGHGLTAKFPTSFGQRPLNAGTFATEPSPLASISLSQYVTAILQTVDQLTAAGFGPISLLGHSMAGIPITAAAEQSPSKIAKLIYLSAFMPVTAAPAAVYLQKAEAATSQIGPLLMADFAQVGALRFDTNSADSTYRQGLKNTFCADISDDAFAAVAHLMQPDDPVQAFGTPTGATSAKWGSVARAYVGCTADNAVPPALQKLFVSEADTLAPQTKTDFRTFSGSHTPFFSNPSGLADLLATLIA
ncbi:alpha/beta hydrolase [Roseateles noduli]|uniref:alpha/beta hydrolase n=1 Tax=Roseateles noduli TaxID=2052484 RepID=UPI003D6491BD